MAESFDMTRLLTYFWGGSPSTAHYSLLITQKSSPTHFFTSPPPVYMNPNAEAQPLEAKSVSSDAAQVLMTFEQNVLTADDG